MGKFKMQSPIKLDPVPRYDVPFMPDNVEDNSGLVAKANKNGTMIVNKNISKNSKLFSYAIWFIKGVGRLVSSSPRTFYEYGHYAYE